ncbi:ABC transporter substrate-binding protein [Calidithermus timidus]|jgi:multiple sugar transport system substrate-binding protein|uniref:ABC transporter substrate-binding protein n=1 Tax=Calidithermus timidus TaxID=307124 RepID=UPI000360EA9C|nr:sugar ABC transporter substrate-binding protein [Calidithermus timidus]
MLRKTFYIGLALVAGGVLLWGTAQTTTPSGSFIFMIFGDPAEKAAYDKLVAAFSQRYPQVKVEILYIPSQTSYRTRLAADLAAGTPADVFLLNYRRYAQFAARGVLEPLDSYVAQSRVLKLADFYPEALEPFYWNRRLMGIPQNLSSLVVYYNKNLFDKAGVPYPKAGWTWNDFLQTAKALTKDTNGDGITDQFGLGTEASIFRVAPFIWQNRGDLVDDPKSPKRLTLDAPATKEALQWFMDLQVKHKVVPNKLLEKARPSEERFLDGTLAMFLNSRRGVPTYREIQDFDWDVAPLPRGKEQAGILHADAFFMAAASRNKPAAWAFIEFANSKEGQSILAESGRTVPSLKSVAQSPAFLNPNSKPQNSRVFLDTIPYIRAVPVMETWADIETLVSEDLERAFHGDVTLEEAIKAATARTQRFFPSR